ncbi:MAG: sulfotransferase domain-containing protein [Porticoccaceae bacterium]
MQLISRKPNFFIIGGPKCGTTSLAHYLGEHPDIFMSDLKEPFYFSPDVIRSKDIETEASYLKLFAKADARHVAIGEGSTSYLYSDVAVSEIMRFNPEARFIVCLRNPVEMVHSLHSQRLYVEMEDIEDFRQAWLTQDRKIRMKPPSWALPTPKFFRYADQCKLGLLLERLYQAVCRENIFCVFFGGYWARYHAGL